ncbi:hypothetical protein HanPI659440_Chr16g0618671 [Helianthus annuus]|nr:hypothetical protein HanPI659440_Chr16g0618671 [Helianthus annuus]
MNGKGGYCIAKYGGGGMYGFSKVDSIMLKFRPIAPKPVTTGLASSAGDEYVKCGRGKRKYVRVKKIIRKKKDNFKRCGGEKKKLKTSPPAYGAVVTLPLLPETPDRKENKPVKYENKVNFSGSFSDHLVCPVQQNKKLPVWLCFNNMTQPPVRRPQVQVVSNVTVECVTDTWVDTEGCTDEERVRNMEKDTCPGFISDGEDRVVWTNKAYREMAGGDDIRVVLVRKDKRTLTYPAFTCKVRVQQTPSATLTLPCDVWRMGRGACAWRLDVKAALSLGR